MRLPAILDRNARTIQNWLGPRATQFVLARLSNNSARFVRELLGRSAPHRVQVVCNKEPIGEGGGAWTICPDKLNRQSVIYSLGIGTDISFDLALIQRFGATVFAFDPTSKSMAWLRRQRLPEEFRFFEWGVADFDGSAHFRHVEGSQYTISISDDPSSTDNFQVYRLRTIMDKLGHQSIDLIKINIEGGEYPLLTDILRSRIPIRQLVLEFHHRFPGFTLAQTEEAVRALNQEGYRIFHITDSGREYSFIRP